MRTSAAPTCQLGMFALVSSGSVALWVARWARSSNELSSELCIDIRTVRNAPSATKATASPTAIVVSSTTRLASERR